jgi:hypothetical protein
VETFIRMKRPVFAILALAAAFILISSNSILPASSISKKIVFPVVGTKAKIGSFWGAVRGGGTRKHRGIDIFAKKGTPLVAISDGVVTSVGNGAISGKTVWLRSNDHPITAYYAHLDQQKVKPGQRVKKGQVIGTVGNTGNARTTPSHLHFGIYTNGDAVNPLPYVKSSPRLNRPVAATTVKPAKKTVTKPKATTTASSVKKQDAFPEKYIWKRMRLNQHPSYTYYVTTAFNVVDYSEGEVKVIGRMTRTNSASYPYLLFLSDQKMFYVTRSGTLYNSGGEKFGLLY